MYPNKTVYIMRGVSGSGKSHEAKMMAFTYNGVVHSTDDFFVKNGKYQFDKEKLKENHKKNQKAFLKSLKMGIRVVICDNTNIKLDHMKPYEKMALTHGYDLVYVTMPHPDPAVAAKNNIHNVPEFVIRKQIEQWEKM